MLSAYNRFGKQVVAWDVTKADGPFTCPECRQEVVVKKGSVVVHHFAHSASSTCKYGTGESAEHWLAKFEIYEALRKHPRVTSLMVEPYLGSVKPDVSFWLDKVHVALELQRSKLSPNWIAHRTRLYDTKKIHVLWMPPYSDGMKENKRYAPHFWEKYLHALYFGRVYYWLRGATILPVHFNECMIGEAYHRWYDKDKGMWVDGHYSKRFRMPTFQEQVLITDLQALKRGPWHSGSFTLPEARLWCLLQVPHDDNDVANHKGEQV
jgi:competence protein CoiA